MTDITQIIKSIVAHGKISGSWIIEGPYGVGKRQFARELSSYILSGQWQTSDDFHPDVKWIERSLTEEEKKETVKAILAGKELPATNANRARKKEITVDDIREGLKFLSLKSSEEQFRILIIHLADDMNENAANALLKALEEPPKRALILLLCQNTGHLLPTIASRCRKITLRPWPHDKMRTSILKLQPGCSDVDLVMRLSNGSIGLAGDILNHDGIELYRKIVSFCVPTQRLDIQNMTAFVDTISKNEMKYFLSKTFILNIINDLAKKEAPYDPVTTNQLIDIYHEAESCFYQIESLYLDKKTMIMNLFFKIAEVMK